MEQSTMMGDRSVVIRRCYFPAVFVIFGTLVSGFVNSIASALGLDFPYTTFLFSAGDRFADFFKVALSFPGPEIDDSTWYSFIREYRNNNPFGGIDALQAGRLTHLHITPVRELLYLVIRRCFSYFDPMKMFVIYFSSYLVCFSLLVKRFVVDIRLSIVLIVAALMSYPLLFIIDRGNVSSSLGGMFVTFAVLLAIEKSSPIWVATFIAMAVNFRPNWIILFSVFFLFRPISRSVKLIAVCGVFSIVLCGCFLFMANHVYPDYTCGAFVRGVGVYYKDYVIGDGGLAYGSSFLGGLKFIGLSRGGVPYVDQMVSIGVFLFLLASIALFVRKSIGDLTFIYLLLALCALGTNVFADYHLLPFFGILLSLSCKIAKEERLNRSELFVLLCVILVLVPKNYVFSGDSVSYQVVLNPVILLVGVAAVFVDSIINALANRRIAWISKSYSGG